MSNLLAEWIETFRRSKAEYDFFDINAWLPLSEKESLYPITEIGPLAAELGHHCLNEAVITHGRSLAYSARAGNEDIVAAIRGKDGLYGGIVWTPELAYSKREVAAYLDRMIDGNIVIVRLFPKKLNYSLGKWQLGDLFAAMEDRRLPLMVWHTEASWDAIQAICEAYPNLPVIVEGNDQKLLYHNRFFTPLLERHENLYLETHSLIQHEIFEYLVNERGVDRLLFGSYLPHQDPNGSMLMVTGADMPEEAKRNIAGGHFRRLAKGILRG